MASLAVGQLITVLVLLIYHGYPFIAAPYQIVAVCLMFRGEVANLLTPAIRDGSEASIAIWTPRCYSTSTFTVYAPSDLRPPITRGQVRGSCSLSHNSYCTHFKLFVKKN